jgi:ribosomal protein S18 acetylase RimI-like enzyme
MKSKQEAKVRISNKEVHMNGLAYTIRSSTQSDAKDLSELRLQIDGETENLDRESGEAFIDESGFKQLIHTDAVRPRNLFLVAVADTRIVGFSRCEGSDLKRFSHKVEFGVCVLKDYWGYGIGKNLLKESIAWADSNKIRKVTLNVLETNHKAIELYKKLGFEVEGILKNDKILSDGKYYNTIVMGRFHDTERLGYSIPRWDGGLLGSASETKKS